LRSICERCYAAFISVYRIKEEMRQNNIDLDVPELALLKEKRNVVISLDDSEDEEIICLFTKEEPRDLDTTIVLNSPTRQFTSEITIVGETASIPKKRNRKVEQTESEANTIDLVITDPRSVVKTLKRKNSLDYKVTINDNDDDSEQAESSSSRNKKKNYLVVSDLTDAQKLLLRKKVKKSKMSDGSYKCCGKQISHNSIRNHVYRIHIKNTLSAEEIVKRRWMREAMDASRCVDENGAEKWVCAECSREFFSVGGFRYHIKSHLKDQ
jgi:hypothetical protein